MKKTLILGSIFFASVLVGCGRYQSKIQAQEASQSWEAEGKTVEVVSIPSEETIERRREDAERHFEEERDKCRSQPGYQLYKDDPDMYIRLYPEKESNLYTAKQLADMTFIDCDVQLDLEGFYSRVRKGEKYMRETRSCIDETETNQFVCKEVKRKGDEYDWTKYNYKYFRW